MMVGCPGTPGPTHWGPRPGHQPLRCQWCIQTTVSSTKTPKMPPPAPSPTPLRRCGAVAMGSHQAGDEPRARPSLGLPAVKPKPHPWCLLPN